MIIVSGNGKRGHVKYGCPSHRYRGVCANNVLIRRDRLEDQLLDGLTNRVLSPAAVDFALKHFQIQLERRMKELREQADNAANGIAALQGKRQELKMQVDRVTDAIATIGHSPSLLSKLGAIEAEISRLDDRLAEMNQTRDLSLSVDGLRSFLAEIGRLLPWGRGNCERFSPNILITLRLRHRRPRAALCLPFRETLSCSTSSEVQRTCAAVMVARDGFVQ